MLAGGGRKTRPQAELGGVGTRSGQSVCHFILLKINMVSTPYLFLECFISINEETKLFTHTIT